MAIKKLSVSIEVDVYEKFRALCEANEFKVNNVIANSIAEPEAFIEFAISRREKAEREAKAAKILQLKNELGLSDADLKKLLKNSEQVEEAPAKSVKNVIESRQAHKGTYEDEDVTWEVDRYGDGYFCYTSDGKPHKKDVKGNLIS